MDNKELKKIIEQENEAYTEQDEKEMRQSLKHAVNDAYMQQDWELVAELEEEMDALGMYEYLNAPRGRVPA